MRKKKIEKMRGVEDKASSFKPQAASKGKAASFEQRASGKKSSNQYSKKEHKQEMQPADIPLKKEGSNEQMPLNKFIAHAGVCGRREAADLVKEGKVTVNGDKIFEPGYKVSAKDKVIVKGKQVFLQRNAVYILLNKPKDYITTANDPQGRKTVLDLIKGATPERVYPVGRLDRNTTGVLILTMMESLHKNLPIHLLK